MGENNNLFDRVVTYVASAALLVAGIGVLMVGIKFKSAQLPPSAVPNGVVYGEEGREGGNMSLQSSAQKADIQPVASSTLNVGSSRVICSLVNDDQDQQDRIIQEVQLYLKDSSGTFTGGVSRLLYAATSTSATATSTDYNSILNGVAFTSSTAPQRVSTSTFSAIQDRTWSYGKYLNILFSHTASSTGGYCKVVYDKAPLN